MRIKRVTLSNYRGYKQSTTILFNDLTVFVGQNDVGKSTILEALDLFFNDGKGIIKYDKSDINMEDVAESMGLLHTVDTCFGIIQTDEMRMGSGNEDADGQPVPFYFLKILKIREGEGRDTKFKIDANYKKMKLFERTETIDTLSHLIA